MPASGPYVSPNEELALKITPKVSVTTVQQSTPTAAPNASQDMFGWCRRGEYWRIPVSARPARKPGRPADDHPERVQRPVPLDVAAEREEHERHREQEADAHREDEGPPVLLDRGRSRSSVDPVRRALDLTERGRRGDGRPDQPERERQVTVPRRPRACCTASVRSSPARPGMALWIVSTITRLRGCRTRPRIPPAR